jgi:hypothetical protein
MSETRVAIPAMPATLADNKATALRMRAYNKTLRTESVIYDVFEALSGEIRTDPKGFKMPEAIFLKLDTVPDGAHSVTVGLMKRLSGAAQMGTDENMLGQEESLKLKHLTCYYNEIKKSVASFGWGIDANDVSYLNVYGQINPLMTEYFKELRGRRIREATLLTVAQELTKAPISLAHQFNPNIFVPNTLLGNMPAYDYHAITEGTTATYPANDALYEASGTSYFIKDIWDTLSAATNTWANPERCNLTVESLLALAYHVEHNLLIDPIMIDGQPTHIFLVPANQAIKIMNPVLTGSLGSVWKDVSALTKTEASIPGVMGRVKNLLLVADARYATITLSGDAIDPVITPGFLQPGRADGRNHAEFAAGNKVFDVGAVYGKGSLVEWVANPLKYATESTEYGKFQGKGAYQMAGIQLAVFDEDTKTNSSYQQNSSCVVFMSKPALVTVT